MRLAVAMAVVALGGVQPVPVLTGMASEEGPAANARWLAWMQSAGPNPRPPESATSVFVRSRSTGTVFRVNPPGTYAETGGLEGSTLAIQLLRTGSSRLALVDLRTRRLRVLGSWVNTRKWQWRPSLSGRFLLFGRIDYTRGAKGVYEIVLADLRARTTRTLASVGGHAAYAAPGQVNGNYAVWIACPDNACSAYRYDLRTGRTVHVPNGGRSYYLYWQIGPSVTRRGIVYFGRGRHCADFRLMRFDGRRVSSVLHFPPNTAFQYSYVDDSAGRASVYYDRVGCGRSDLSDVYRIDAG